MDTKEIPVGWLPCCVAKKVGLGLRLAEDNLVQAWIEDGDGRGVG